MLAPSLKPRRIALADAKVVQQGGSVASHVVDRERLPGCHGTSVPAAVHQDHLIAFLQIPLIGVEYMMGLAVSMEHQDRCSVADNLIVEMCLGSIKICAFHDAFFPSGKTGCPRGFRSGSGSLPLRKTYPESDASEGKQVSSGKPLCRTVFFLGAVQILKAIAVV